MRTPLLLLSCALLPFATQAQGWQDMADVPYSLAFPVVVELQGNIHVIGGGSGQGATDVHLRYTPATDSWTTLAPVPYSAQQPCGTVVNGKIHFCGGGFPNTGSPLNDHYVYDPGTDAWTQATDLPFPTAINEAASIDGKLFVLSGQPDKQLCQSYDPQTTLWTAHNDLPDMNFWYGAIVAANNTIHRFGGGGYMAPTDAAHVYAPVGDTWNSLPDIPSPIHSLAGAAVNDSTICLAGGYYNFADLDNVWLYHTNTQQYEVLDPLPAGRSYHAVVLVDGCIYVVGGNSSLDPDMGLSLIRNCSVGVSVQSIEHTADPYTITTDQGSITVRLTPGTGLTGASFAVIDGAGRMVHEVSLRSGEATVNSSHLGAGAYTIHLHVDGRSFSERWVAVR
jgi:hypothetical protein